MADRTTKRATSSRKKGRAISKSNLPQKICAVCQRPFSWRKKWRDCWDEVKYCSHRCRGERQGSRA